MSHSFCKIHYGLLEKSLVGFKKIYASKGPFLYEVTTHELKMSRCPIHFTEETHIAHEVFWSCYYFKKIDGYFPQFLFWEQTKNLHRGPVSLPTTNSPSWICPTGTGRCCVLLERPLIQYDTEPPGSLLHAHRSCHPRPGRIEKKEGAGVNTAKKGSIQRNPS